MSKFRVSTAPNELTWDLCASTPSGVEHQTGSHSLSAADLDSINEAVGHLTPTSPHDCGADASVITVDETTSNGVQLLADDFYSGCPWGRLLGRTFVKGVETLANTLETLKDE